MNVFVTLDYELFMGRNTGTPVKCLIEPINALSKVSIKYGARLTIFVDAAYLLRLSLLSQKYSSLRYDYMMVCDNIKGLSSLGHDIELHFHPQWLYSTFGDNGWEMDLDHYKLSDIPKEEVFDLFTRSKYALDNLIEYNTVAFRAGGYSLNSFEQYPLLLRSNNIKIDSSVIARKCVNSRFQSYDYREVPLKDYWRFEDDVAKEVANGSLKEYPISTTPEFLSLVYMIKKRRYIKELGENSTWGDGQGIGVHMKRSEKIHDITHKLTHRLSFPASIDGFNSLGLVDIYNNLCKQGVNNMVIIGHPKNTSLKSISNFEEFLKRIYRQNNITTFREHC